MVGGAGMLIGSIGGGILGNIDLSIPYLSKGWFVGGRIWDCLFHYA